MRKVNGETQHPESLDPAGGDQDADEGPADAAPTRKVNKAINGTAEDEDSSEAASVDEASDGEQDAAPELSAADAERQGQSAVSMEPEAEETNPDDPGNTACDCEEQCHSVCYNPDKEAWIGLMPNGAQVELQTGWVKANFHNWFVDQVYRVGNAAANKRLRFVCVPIGKSRPPLLEIGRGRRTVALKSSCLSYSARRVQCPTRKPKTYLLDGNRLRGRG